MGQIQAQEGVEGVISTIFTTQFSTKSTEHFPLAFTFLPRCSATLKKMPRAFFNIPYI